MEAVVAPEETVEEEEAEADAADEAVEEAVAEAMEKAEVETASASKVAVEMSKIVIAPRQNMSSSAPSRSHSSGRFA